MCPRDRLNLHLIAQTIFGALLISGSSLTVTHSVQAATLRYDFEFKLPQRFAAAPGAVGQGYFIYDDTDRRIPGAVYANVGFSQRRGTDTPFPYSLYYDHWGPRVQEFRLNFLGQTFDEKDDVLRNPLAVYRMMNDGSQRFCGVAFTLRWSPAVVPLKHLEMFPECYPNLIKPNFINDADAIDFYGGKGIYVRGRASYPYSASATVNYTLTNIIPDPPPVPLPLVVDPPVPLPEPLPIPIPEPPPPPPVITIDPPVSIATPMAVPEVLPPLPPPILDPAPEPTPTPIPSLTPAPTPVSTLLPTPDSLPEVEPVPSMLPTPATAPPLPPSVSPTAVPEPATLLALLSAGVGFWVQYRRDRHQSFSRF